MEAINKIDNILKYVCVFYVYYIILKSIVYTTKFIYWNSNQVSRFDLYQNPPSKDQIYFLLRIILVILSLGSRNISSHRKP